MKRLFVGLILIALLLVLPCLGLEAVTLVPFHLAFGWIPYLARVSGSLTWSPEGIATAGVCLAGFALGLHAFLKWARREMGGAGATWRARWTASLVVLVLLMFTAGLAAAGLAHQVGWLITGGERLFSSSGGMVVQRVQSTNNLRQIGMAAYQYHQEFADVLFPSGASTDDVGTFLHSWQTLILPYIDQRDLAARIDMNRPWDVPANRAALAAIVQAYASPLDLPRRDADGRALSYYEGNARVVGRTTPLRLQDVPDGTSNTILAGEVAGNYLPWGRPGHWRDPADGINQAPDRGFGSRFPGGANILMLDGSTRFLRNSTQSRVLQALGTPDGSETINADAY